LSVFVHATAVVDDGVEIGEGSKIWHFCHLQTGCRLGPDCNMGQNVYVGQDVEVGAGARVQNNVSIYSGVTLEDHVFLGPSMVFTNVRTPRAAFERKDAFERTRVCTGASIGANATVVCGVTIGAYATIGAGAVVTSDVAAHALVLGVPAAQAGWMCRCGERLDLDELGRASCTRCEDRYQLSADTPRTLHRTSP
jgi:UDP-2-acetamido-3-amino-2,3-dideoxy-glucuronate N-acetyltransferase